MGGDGQAWMHLLVQDRFSVENGTFLGALFGPATRTCVIERDLNVRIVARGNELIIDGSP